MNDYLINFLLGTFIKIVDDHYDLNVYDTRTINIIKVIGFFLLNYVITTGFEYILIFFLEVIICYFAKQIDNIFFKKIATYIIVIFISYLLFYQKEYFNKVFNLQNISIYFFFACSFIIIEQYTFKEESSTTKLLTRLGILIIAVINMFLHKNKLLLDFTSLFIGYFSISILNLSFRKIIN